jgi:hypothetical protein
LVTCALLDRAITQLFGGDLADGYYIHGEV